MILDSSNSFEISKGKINNEDDDSNNDGFGLNNNNALN
jgi:hypothetical protein